jgi:hypothetical protein
MSELEQALEALGAGSSVLMHAGVAKTNAKVR